MTVTTPLMISTFVGCAGMDWVRSLDSYTNLSAADENVLWLNVNEARLPTFIVMLASLELDAANDAPIIDAVPG